MTTLTVRCSWLSLSAALLGTIAPPVCAQLASLDKGHQLLVNSGLQIWGCDTGASSFTYSKLTGGNMNAVMWSFGQSNPALLSAGQKWGKWVAVADESGNFIGPGSALNGTEQTHYADLTALQVGDEQQTDMEDTNGKTKMWFNAAHDNGLFTDKLLYVNSFYIGNDDAYARFLANANPDAISFDSYPFGTVIAPVNWLGKAQQFRRHAVGSYINPGATSPRPYGLYLQTYESTSEGTRHPGDLEMRWQQFTAWTLGYTFIDAFTVGGATSLFYGGSMNDPMDGDPLDRSPKRYTWFQESARQSLNLGPALTKLISYSNGPAGGGTSIVRGRDPSGNLNAVPISWKDFNANDAPPNQRYLTSVSAKSLSHKNGVDLSNPDEGDGHYGYSGDVYVGFFNPLLTSYGDPAGTTYFMITNALGAYLQDPTLLVTEAIQQITLDFNFGASGINSLQRLSRETGQVEVLPLTHVSGDHYRYIFNLDGGTGDLFKYNDGSPFVGVPFSPATVYWDSDALAAGNNTLTGAGLGGSGNWNATSSNWYNTAANVPWAAGNDAVFVGTAGTVTLSSPQFANSLRFKTTGYNLTGSTITLTAPTVTVDAGVTATIGSAVAGSAGLVKTGAGTLNLAIANTYSGGTTIDEGVLGIISNTLGANPASPSVNITINNGAKLRFNQNNLTLTAQRQVLLGPGGGVVDTEFSNGISGAISGSSLTKTGSGTLTLTGNNTHASTVVNGGALRVSVDGALGAAPANFTPGNITLDGGTLRFGANFDLSNNRGVALGAAGGTIDTQGFNNLSGYTQANGISGSGNLTKIGSGTFFMNTPAGQLNNGWTGNLILKEGTWTITERGGLPFNPPQTPGSPVITDQITFDGGTLQIVAAIPNVTNGRRGITVAAGGGTFDTQGFTFKWAGPLAGNDTAAVLTKTGSGTLQFNTNAVPAPSTYAGNFNVAQGSLVINGGAAMGDLAAISLANAAGVQLTISGASETIGSLAGGGAAGGNVSLNASLTAGGNGKSTTFSGSISGSGALIKNGPGTLTLAPPVAGNTYSGGTTVNGGTLLVTAGEGARTGSGSVVVNSGATLGGAGSIVGAVTLNAGAHLAPGFSIGSLDVGPLAITTDAILDFELDTIAGADISDLVNVRNVGGLTINGGTLNLTDAGNMTAGTYKLIEYDGSFNGSISDIELGNVPAGFDFELVDNSTTKSIDLVVTSTGDFNADGFANAADYVTWRKGLGFTPGDYDDWKRNFGRTLMGGGASYDGFSNVPEPFGEYILTITLLLIACNTRDDRDAITLRAVPRRRLALGRRGYQAAPIGG